MDIDNLVSGTDKSIQDIQFHSLWTQANTPLLSKGSKPKQQGN
jgi:hypothetical protein